MAETYGGDNGGVALAIATAKTCLEMSTPSTQTNRIIDAFIGCDATTSGTLKVELITGTTGTGTAYTPKKLNGEAQNRVANTTMKINDTVEPTSTTVLKTWMFPLPLGGMMRQLPLGREVYMPASSMYGLRFTSSIVANAYVNVEVEE